MCIIKFETAEIMKEKAIKNQQKILKKEEKTLVKKTKKLIKIIMKKIKKASKRGETGTSFYIFNMPKYYHYHSSRKLVEIIEDKFMSGGYSISMKYDWVGDIIIRVDWNTDIKE